MVEGLVRLQFVPDRAERRLLVVRILLAGFLAVRRGFLAECARSHDLGQPDAVPFGFVLGIPLLASFLARVLGENVEAADRLFWGRISRCGIALRHGRLLSVL